MADLDKLTIQISANTRGATNQIEKLTVSLYALNKVIDKIDTNKFQSLATATTNLSKSLSGIKGSNVKQLVKAGNALNTIQANGNAFNTATQGATQLNSAAQTANTSLSNVTSTIRNMGNTVSLQNVTRQFRDFDESAYNSETSVKGLKAMLANLKIIIPTEELDKTKAKFEKVKDEARELQQKINDVKFGNIGLIDQEALERDEKNLEGLLNELDRLKLKIEDLQSHGGFQLNIASAAELAKNAFSKLSSTLGSLTKKSLEFVTAFSGIPMAIDATKGAFARLKGRFNDVIKSLARIWKMLNLMVKRMILRKVITGVSDGFKNLAKYSGEFDSSVSLLWNSFKQLGNSIASAVSPLLNALAPALNYIIQLCIKAVNVVNQLISLLCGKTTWSKAKTLSDDYASSLDKTSKSANKLKNSILGFDEINQLSDNSSSGGGGSDPTDMFEEIPIESAAKDFADSIMNMFERANLYELGSILGKKLKDALDSIPWGAIRSKARKIGEEIASLINGFVDVSGLGNTIGNTLAQAINTAFDFLNAFVHRLDWSSIGDFIADTLNGLFEGIDWPLIKDTLTTGFAGLADSVNAFVDGFHWNNVSTAIGNMVNTVSTSIYTMFKKIKWDDLGSKIGEQIRQAIRKINWRNLGKAVGSVIQSAINFVKSIISRLSFTDIKNAIHDFIKGAIEEIDSKDLAVLTWTTIGLALVKFAGTILGSLGIGKAFRMALSPILTSTITSLGSAIAGMFAPLMGVTSVVAELFIVKDGVEKLMDSTKDAGSAFAEIAVGVGIAVTACTIAFGPTGTIVALIGSLIGVIAGINEAFDNIDAARASARIKSALTDENGTPISDAFENATEKIRGMANGFDDVVTYGRRLEETQGDIQRTVEKIDSIEGAMDNATISTEEGVAMLTEQFALLADSAQTKFSDLENTLMSAFGSGGAIANALSEIGVDVSAAQVEVTGITADVQKRINEINSQLAGLDPKSEKYSQLKDELNSLIGVTDEVSSAVDEFEDNVEGLGKLDWNDIFNGDDFDTGAFTSKLGDLTSAMSDANGKVSEGSKEFKSSLEEMIKAANAEGLDSTELENALKHIPDAISMVSSDISTTGLEVTNAMQTDVIDKMNDVITKAMDDWDKMNPMERFFSGFDSAEEYALDAVNDYKTNYIDVISREIETQFSDLGIQGAGWASDAAEEIIKSFTESTTIGDSWASEIKQSVSNNYGEVIKQGLEGVKKVVEPQTKDVGKAISDGVDAGFDKQKIVDTVGKGCQAAIDEYARVQDSHSPSEVYKDLSNDSVQGLIDGWEENYKRLKDTVEKVASDTIADFKAINTQEAWMEAIGGIIPAFEAVFQGVFDTIKQKWGEITDWVNEHLYIEIDTSTQVGQNIAKALGSERVKIGSLPSYATGGFPEDGLFFANHGEMVGKFGNGKTAVANNEQITQGIAQAVYSAIMSANSNSNSNGGQYINNTIQIDGETIARAVTKGQNSINRRYSPTMS